MTYRGIRRTITVSAAGIAAIAAVSLSASAAADARELPSSAAPAVAAPTRLLPQQAVPKLDAPGDAKPVTFPPDNLIRPAASTFTFTAPPHTHIIVLEMNCRPRACTESISADGKTATARTPPGRWRFNQPVRVWLQADVNAPMPRADYTGSLTVDREQQPLTVTITEGKQGLLGASHQTAPEGGARVLSVTEGGAADEAGIRAGDTITGFNGQTVTTSEDLRNARIGLLRAGATVPITYRRPDGSTRTTTVTLR